MEDSAAAIIYHGMTFHVVVLCCVTLFLLLVSALVSGSETAFFSLSGNDVRKIRRHDTPVCRRMLNLLGKADLLLATILVVNNLVNIGIVILSSEIIDSLFTFARFEFLFKTVIVTFLLLLFGEILPKVAAQTIPLRFAGFAARPLLVLRWIFYPLSYVLVRTGNRISERAAHHQEISIGELADAIDMTRTASKEEHGMLSGIVSFVNTEVQEIMKPRVDMTAVALTDGYEQVRRTIIESGFSRIPVYEEDLDNIRGTLYVKDLLPFINRGDEFGWQRAERQLHDCGDERERPAGDAGRQQRGGQHGGRKRRQRHGGWGDGAGHGRRRGDDGELQPDGQRRRPLHHRPSGPAARRGRLPPPAVRALPPALERWPGTRSRGR